MVDDVAGDVCLALLYDASAKARHKANAVGLLQAALQVEPQHRGALRLMGRAYQMGEGGLEADDTVAVDYFERAADLGRGGIDNRHSTDVESPPPPYTLRVCMSIFPEGNSCFELGRCLF